MAEIITMGDAKKMAQNVVNKAVEEQGEQKSFFEGFMKDIEAINPELGGFEELTTILGLPDEQFNIIGPIFLDEMNKSLNNANDKLLLTQALNATGGTVEDLQEQYSEIAAQLDDQLKDQIPKNKRDFLKQMLAMTINAISETEGIAKKIIQIPIELAHKDAKIPTYANSGDAGLDIYAIDNFTVHPGETKIIPTGIKVAIPRGYELQVRAKSGRAVKTKFRVANAPGTIDSGYRGEIGVIIDNIEPPIKDITYEHDENGEIHITSILHGSDFHIGKGEKFAQLVLNEVPKAAFYEVDSIDTFESDGRGAGGYGSSGVK